MNEIQVAITGAGGQIGSYLAERLSVQHSGFRVVAICRNSLSAGIHDGTGCLVRVGSITDPDTALRLMKDCEAVVHCALATGLPKQSRLLNEAMMRNIARVPTVKRIVYFSSVAVYSSCIDRELNTYTNPRPDTSYGKDKLVTERQALSLFVKPDRQYFVLRLGHVYGPYQTMSKNFLTWAQNEDFCLPFDGNLLSNAIHIEQLGDAVIDILSGYQGSGIYNLVDHTHHTWREVFDWHTEAVGLPAVPGMSIEKSQSIKTQYLEQKRKTIPLRLAGEVVRWMRSAPSQLVFACPSIRELTYGVLLRMPVAWERQVKTIYRRIAVDRDIQSGFLSDLSVSPEPWLLSDPMPGPYFVLSRASSKWNLSQEIEHKERLARWFNKWANPNGAWVA